MRILIVDDEAEIRRILRILLENAKYEVIEASDGAAAVEAVKNDRSIDLCIMDVKQKSNNAIQKQSYHSVLTPTLSKLKYFIYKSKPIVPIKSAKSNMKKKLKEKHKNVPKQQKASKKANFASPL